MRNTRLINVRGWQNSWIESVQGVYGQGGRFFWIHNTGPFGCLPYVLDRFPIRAPEVDHVGCGSPFNDVAQLFNAKLKETVAQLRKDLPQAVFTYVDVYTIKYSLISQAKKHSKTCNRRWTNAEFNHGFRYWWTMLECCNLQALSILLWLAAGTVASTTTTSTGAVDRRS